MMLSLDILNRAETNVRIVWSHCYLNTIYWEILKVKNFAVFWLAHNLKNFCMAISAELKVEHPWKFIREQFQSEGSSKILYLEISQYTELKWTDIQ